MGPSPPVVSVVVATRDRPERLRALLDGLGEQTLAPEEFEVIVVDEASGPRTAEVLAGERGRLKSSLEVVRHPRPLGPGAARNAGWRRASAALVAFTDDDCRPGPRWLAAGLEAHRAHPGAFVQGRTEPDPHEFHGPRLLSRTVHREKLGPHYETCNMFYPRALLERLGGFDEGFGLRPGGEDTDLACRALESGAEAVFAPQALVHHAVEDLGPVGMLRFGTRWTETMRIFARHPAARSMLYRRLFWNVWHYLLVRSLAALVLPRPLRRFVLLRHALQLQARARELGAGPWAVPYLALYDLIEVASVVRGGLRYRTPVI